MMKCPYTVHRKTTKQTVWEYNEEQVVVQETVIENNMAEFVDCVEKKCAMYNWADRKCKYRALED